MTTPASTAPATEPTDSPDTGPAPRQLAQADLAPQLPLARANLARREGHGRDDIDNDDDPALVEGIDPFAPIELSSSLPSTASSPPTLASLFDSTFAALDASTASLLSSSLPASLAARFSDGGVPGTALSAASQRTALQAALDCAASEGQWVHDPRGDRLVDEARGLVVHKQDPRYNACDKRFYKGRAPASRSGDDAAGAEWDVRPSLKWRWEPSPLCPALPRPPSTSSSSSSRTRFCTLLAHKSILLVGDSTQYSLHDLVLDHAATAPQSCYGDLYCKEHLLCADVLAAARQGRDADVETAERDERVFGDVPLPPGMTSARHLERRAAAGAHGSSAKSRYSSAATGTLLRYRRSDGLRPSTQHTAPTYRHPATGVREVNQPWLADARRSDVVVVTKPPLPLPLRAADAAFWADLDAAAARGRVARAEKLVELAAEWTRETWVPELVDALRAVRSPPSSGAQLVVYRSGWRQHADCAAPLSSEGAGGAEGDGLPPRGAPPGLEALLGAPSEGSFSVDGDAQDDEPDVPLHIAWHNAQLVLQNAVTRATVVPAFGAVYLDLETPLSIWRSGMVGSSAAPSASQALVFQGAPQGPGAGLRTPASGDCTRYCLPSPGLALETHFLGALASVFEAGWAGEESEFEHEWVGEGFVGIKEREQL
ncbi:uncharacterized protein RHOBADRAFT_55216 [Rhodotorula graminis WP1]|uniref:Uncharacterized protein n=1 Tax=Rhodotorula graminis (strain WP1) TaxID=578459 RepID=A0A0P9EMF8_RHOGW|nr:uncharacterized protein RHOBADRAFT_55216 [Rhodotorula graminis WP1]KPV72967.1 hypothetical protein RHOBADRAFT_55216 [Rhodotorula graminis WP1]